VVRTASCPVCVYSPRGIGGITFNQIRVKMKYLKISNAGELDIRIIALMGGTTKADDSYKIGNFGTGLKYTMAFLFREGIDFHIFSGKKEVNIELERETIGAIDFDIICINGHRTSITTQMGNDWEAWMIVRELYSNALDEGDANYTVSDVIEGVEGSTSIYLEFTAQIMEVLNNWNDYFIVGAEPFYEEGNLKMFPQSGKLKIYKQGILVYTDAMDSLFNYDILDANINELREYKGAAEGDVVRALKSINDTKVIQYFLENVNDKHFEAQVDWDWYYNNFSKGWKEALNGVKIIHQKAKDDIEARGIEIDTAANVTVPAKLYKGLTQQFEGIGALRVSKAVNEFFEIYNETLQDKVTKAQKMLEDTGYYIDPELKFIYGIFGDKNVLAKIDIDTKLIYISEKHLDTDMFSICTMLVEENEHYKTGFNDHTREFQQHFIDMYVNNMFEGSNISVI
jgi:DNA-binding transcriptional regulator GbsR (MarR family)